MVTAIREAPRPAGPTSWMLARLTLETQAHHAAIDDALLGPLTTPTRASYRHFLARMYGFEAPVGCALASTPGLDAAFVVPRIRAGWLATDLMALGLTPTESAMLRMRHPIPPLHDRAEALGWLYVIERTTLRHELIRRKVSVHAPDVLAIAGTYLHAYRSCAQQAWNELGGMLDRTATTVILADRIAQAAHAAFESQRAWLEASDWDGF